jgi:hypothetical protein
VRPAEGFDGLFGERFAVRFFSALVSLLCLFFSPLLSFYLPVDLLCSLLVVGPRFCA